MGAGIRTGILPLRLLQLLQGTTGGVKIIVFYQFINPNFIIGSDSMNEIVLPC